MNLIREYSLKVCVLAFGCILFNQKVFAGKVTFGEVQHNASSMAPLPVRIEARNQSDIVGIQLEVQGYYYSMPTWEWGVDYNPLSALTSETFFNSSNQSDIIFVDLAPFYSSDTTRRLHDFNITGVRLIKSDGSDLKESEFIVTDGVVDFSTSDPDFDNDGITNAVEVSLGMDIYSLDTDGDGISDEVEYANASLDPTDATDATADFDGDGLTNADELIAGTDMNSADTDSDGMNDSDELAVGRNPLLNEPAILVVISGLLLS